MTSLATLFSCTDIDESKNLSISTVTVNNLELIDGTLNIDSKTSLKSIIASYQKDAAGQNDFNDNIRELQKKGFKPLTPILDVNDKEKIEEFILQKKSKNQKTNKSFGINAKTTEEEIDTDDDLISDPALGALLNEDREIIVADSLYKYTETGMYFCLKKDKQKLYNYLNSLTITQKRNTITNRVAPCNQQALKQTEKTAIAALVTQVTDGINRFLPEPLCNPRPNLPSTAVVVLPPAPSPRLIKENLPVTTIQQQGFFEQIFGERESEIQDYGDNHRVKVTFWNQNFYLFSSIGCSARFQKRKKFLGVAWWEKSYADQIELGVNNITYEYKFNVPQYNNSIYATQGEVFFSYKGLNYNQFGVLIPKLPDNPGFPFSTDLKNSVEIYIYTKGFEIDYNLSTTAGNKMFDDLLKGLVNFLPFSSPAKSDLSKALNEGSLEYKILKAVPFDNKVTLSTRGTKWITNNDNAITHYFDFNFVWTWNSSNSSVLDYLKGLNGSTPYTLKSVDLYGAALHNRQWKGIRLVKNN